MEYYWINDPSVNRAVHLKRAVERLQRGGLVATAIDGGHGDALIDADFLGYRIQVGRGAAVLTRMTGVPLIPITVTWGDDWSIDFRIHSAIPRPDIPPQDHAAFDKALIDQTVRFFESYIRTAPEQLRLDRLARLITRPKVA
jgi:lauroyl/myristoyl acyltransferase